MSAETFPIAVAIESLKIFRRVVDRNIADGIAGMEHALEVIENLPAAERRAAAEVCSRGTEALVSAVRMLASVEMSHRAPPPDIDPFELGVTGYG